MCGAGEAKGGGVNNGANHTPGPWRFIESSQTIVSNQSHPTRALPNRFTVNCTAAKPESTDSVDRRSARPIARPQSAQCDCTASAIAGTRSDVLLTPQSHARMIALTLFASTFLLVFALGFQSLNVNNGHYWAAAITSLVIGSMQLVMLKLGPDATLIEASPSFPADRSASWRACGRISARSASEARPTQGSVAAAFTKNLMKTPPRPAAIVLRHADNDISHASPEPRVAESGSNTQLRLITAL
jgi:hypothetical protein